MAYLHPGAFNTFVPFYDVQNGLHIAFARKPTAYPINLYAQVVPHNLPVGKYLRIDPSFHVRVKDKKLENYVWNDGNPAPTGVDNRQRHEFLEFATQRYTFPWSLGFETVQNATWDIVNNHANGVASQALIARTINVWTVLDASGVWEGNTDTATNLGGGKWDAGTATSPFIKRGILAAMEKVLLATRGAINPMDLRLVINPTTARAMAKTEEIHTYLKESQWSFGVLKGTLTSEDQHLYERNAMWGLPGRLYGVMLIVEDTIAVSTPDGAATELAGFVVPDDQAYLLSRPGGIEGAMGVRSFSTVSIFTYRPMEMLVEHMTDVNNKLHQGRVIDHYVPKVTAPQAGYRITDVLT